MTKKEIFIKIVEAYTDKHGKQEFLQEIEKILDNDFVEYKREIEDDITIKGNNKEVLFKNNNLINYLKFRIFNN